MSNNQKGIITYFGLTLILSAVITLPIMIGREVYQYKHYLKPCNIGFEWDDITIYSLVIIFAQIVQIMSLAMFNII